MPEFSSREIITFWFEEVTPQDWWKGSPSFDRLIRERFLSTHDAAIKCELYVWRDEPLSRLAEIIILDQFSRHIYRGEPASFAHDPMTLALAQEAIRARADEALSVSQKAFLYMPFMHSEAPKIHKIAVELFSKPGLENHLEYELRHKSIIDRFGRYPHRNEILGRESTLEEEHFLEQPGSSF